MNRQKLYILKDGEGSTFEKDNELPSLPLPKLKDTLQRYYDSLKPFGTVNELKNSQKIIKEFENGIGGTLQKELEKKASTERNWLEKWWDEYAYHTLRMPLLPYTVMVMPFIIESVGVPETPEYCLKATARCIHFSIEFWDLLRKEKLRPAKSPDGTITFSSYYYRRFYCASRIPGEIKDQIDVHFKTESEGNGPVHGIIISKGRIFKINCINDDDTILTAQQILLILQIIRSTTDSEKLGDCLPVLTSDDRTSWSKNRKYLQELSPYNKELLKLVESSVIVLVLDENEPVDYSECSLLAVTGDYYSKWADRSSILVVFRNGKMACIGEHSAYDGTFSIGYAFFVLLSLLEFPEPDWSELPQQLIRPIEISFDCDDYLKNEVKRVLNDCDLRKSDIIAIHEVFDDYGKDFMKQYKLHPDAFIQMILQLTYFKLHNELASTYETALMRNYHNGRTETVRSCSMDCANFVKTATNPKSSNKIIFESLKIAINKQNYLMSEARKGNGIDRHLFGLWCLAYEKNLDIPNLYSDPLYEKSGGGGNYVLSTSTLGYTINSGFTCPMILDGYGVFYGITSDALYVNVSAYRNSSKTSPRKFYQKFTESMMEMKKILEEVASAKL